MISDGKDGQWGDFTSHHDVAPVPVDASVGDDIRIQRRNDGGCAKIGPAGGSEIRIPAPSIPSTAKNLCTGASA